MYLFTDFDGVLHPEGCSVDLLFNRLDLLQDWLRARIGVEVVISSSWRTAHPIDELRSFFAEDLQERIVGVTPEYMKIDWSQFDGEAPPPRHARHAEILHWLKSRSDPWRPWAALDDQPWLFKPFTRQLVVCDRTTGLTTVQLEALDHLLNPA